MKSIITTIACLCIVFTLNTIKAKAADSQPRNFVEGAGIVKIDSLPSDSLGRYLSNLNVMAFYNSPVDSFLNTIPNTPMNMFVSSCQMGKVSMYNACYLQVTYYPAFIVRIYVNNFTHLPKYSPTLSWDTNLFKQELIHRISVYWGGRCVNGFCKTAN